MQNDLCSIKSWKWPHIMISVGAFCQITVFLFAIIFSISTENLELVFLKECFNYGLIYAAILFPIVLVSLKVSKFYFVLAVLSGVAVVVRLLLMAYLVDVLDLTGSVGKSLIYDSGNITIMGWLCLIANPLSVSFVISIYLFLKEKYWCRGNINA